MPNTDWQSTDTGLNSLSASAGCILSSVMASSYDQIDDDDPYDYDSFDSDSPEHDGAGPASTNPAVEHCLSRYLETLVDSSRAQKSRLEGEREAQVAYRDAIPPLSGSANIRDFIACVAQGILNSYISTELGSRLLYAAQVAHSAATKRQPLETPRYPQKSGR